MTPIPLTAPVPLTPDAVAELAKSCHADSVTAGWWEPLDPTAESDREAMRADFTLSAVPLRGPLATLAELWGFLPDYFEPYGFDVIGGPWMRAIDMTHPAFRAPAVAWLASQGHADAGESDAALLNALRAVCGLPAVVTTNDCDSIPF